MDTFPVHLFNPLTIKPMLSRRTISGGTSLVGDTDTIAVDGGGRWQITFAGIELLDDDQTAAWGAWESYLENGVTRCIVPIALPAQAPRTANGQHLDCGSDLHPSSADPYFPNANAFASPFIVASTTAAAALRATELNLTMTRGRRLKGDEPFTIVHAGVGPRLYRVMRVVSTSGQNQTVKIRPPLREAVASGAALDFDWPRFVGQQVPDTDISPDLEWDNTATVAISFREAA